MTIGHWRIQDDIQGDIGGWRYLVITYLKAQQIAQNKSTKTLIQFYQMDWRDLSILSNTITFYFY